MSQNTSGVRNEAQRCDPSRQAGRLMVNVAHIFILVEEKKCSVTTKLAV